VSQSYAFQPTASDADGDKLTFTIKNAGLGRVQPDDGTLVGNPSSSSTGSFANITTGVSDGKVSALAAFTINVRSAE
jgi:hypothetical protein